MPLLSYTIPNLINGVSQQSKSQRRDTQAEANVNILNSPVDGAVSRPPSELIKFHPGVDVTNSYSFFLIRGDSEKHVVVIRNGSIRIWNLVTGAEATVNTPHGLGYLAVPGWAEASQSFSHVSVEDTTFLANKSVIPVLNSGSTSPGRPKEAVAFFRAGNYKEQYSVTMTYLGVTRTYSIKTVNNATAGNEEFIRTNFLAWSMGQLLTGVTPPNVTVVNNGGGVDIRTLGFTVTQVGSTIVIQHSSDFTIKAEDGTADSAFRVVKDQVQKFSDLPTSCIDGVIFKVAGTDAAKEDDYWVQFKSGGSGNSTGIWEETTAPGTVLGFDDATLPWTISSSGGDVFTLSRQVWAKRVSGDGVVSAKNPEFAGKAIQDLFWWRGRLGVLTEGSFSLSAVRQPYTFFPSTAQAKLADDPISYKVAHTKVAEMRHAVVYNNQLMFWADGVQFVVNSGDIVEEATMEVAAASEYDHNSRCRPTGAGSNVYFPATNGDYASIWEYFVSNQGISKTADDVTAQAPSYIPGDVSRIVGATSLKMLVILTESERWRLYTYNYFIAGEDKLQSAISYWEFDAGSNIQAMEFDNSMLYILVQRSDGLSLEKVNCQPIQRDPDMSFKVRLDRRTTEAAVSMTYSPSLGTTTFYAPAVTPLSTMQMVARYGSTLPPGTEFEILSVDNLTRKVTVSGDVTGEKFYLGFRIPPSRYVFSEFFPKDQNNVFTPSERVQIKSMTLVHANTGYYQAKVTHSRGKVYTYEFTGRVLGDPENMTDSVALDSGEFRFPVKANARRVEVSIVNDSFLPSSWQSAEYQYTVTQRARKVK